MSCFSSVLLPTKYLNFKETLICIPAFGNNEFRFCQDTLFYFLALQLAFSAVVKAAVGTATSSLQQNDTTKVLRTAKTRASDPIHVF
jgi:hypothetical protein